MRVKVFTAVTVQEAMAQVKRELGLDAVILHTKQFHKGGFLGYRGKEMVEVTAAVEDVVRAPKSKVVAKEPMIPKKMVQNYKMKTVVEPEDTMNNIKQNDDFPIVTQPAAMQNASERQWGEDKQAEKIMQLQRELDSMKIMLEKVISESAQDKGVNKSLLEILRDNEVQDGVAQEIISDIFDESILANSDLAQTMYVLTDYFERMFRPARGIEIPEEGTKIVALIGATGIGKTTTIAKIAAKFVLEEGCSVALITADTYRISAVEQLRTYSDIIGLPLEIVYSPVELKAAINKHRDKQLILIDTAGRSQHNVYQLTELQELLAVDTSIEKHLVLSATTKYKDAIDIIRKFSFCAPDGFLFTKLDETSSIGVIVNLMHKYPITLSYFTNGQSVPDDIFVADSRKLAELILR